MTADQMREVDRIAVEEFGLGILQMMENAGRNLALNVMDMLDSARGEVTVLAGAGGNGGGGLCCARHLHNRGFKVWVVLDRDPRMLRGAAANQLNILQPAGCGKKSVLVTPHSGKEGGHMLKKRYIKSRKVCKVTFEVPEAELPEAIEAESVHLVGEFNDWDTTATPMTRRKGGVFRVTLELEPGREYQFRYLVNGEHWYNDWHADAYVPSGSGEDNCVVMTPIGDSPA